METAAIQLYDRIQDPIEAAIKIGTFIAQSGMFGCTKAEQGPVIGLTCMSERISLVQFGRTYHIVDGKLNKKALAIHAEFRKNGGKVKWITGLNDKTRAEAEFTFEGQTIKGEFTMDEAKAQGIVRKGSAWEKQPSNMLRARLLSNAIAMLCPEIVAGVSGGAEDEPEITAEPKQIFSPPTPKPEAPKIVVSAPEPQPAATQPEPQRASIGSDSAPVDVEFTELVSRAEVDPETGKLNLSTVKTLQSVIKEENCERALNWFKAKFPGKNIVSLFDAPVEWAQKIIDQPGKFIEHIGGAK